MRRFVAMRGKHTSSNSGADNPIPADAAQSMPSEAWAWLSRPIPAASLIVFRVVFGLFLAWEGLDLLRGQAIEVRWIDPLVLFPYPGFGWLRPLPSAWMHSLAAVLFVAGVCLAAGWRPRTAAAVFLTGFLYLFLLDQTLYLNHYYLVLLLAGLMAWMAPRNDERTIAAWRLDIVRFQVGLVYFYGGLAKINADWLRGEPIRTWFYGKTDLALIGPYVREEWFVALISGGGLLLDLFIVPLLLFQRTRLVAVLLLAGFHLTNAYVFSIGIFPWLMLAATTLFFPPDWPRRVPFFTMASRTASAIPPAGRWTRMAVTLWVLVQVLVPLRHLALPGDPGWTEEGHRYAWHMKLRTKVGETRFVVQRASGAREEINPLDDLSPRQYAKMSTHPRMIRQYAFHLKDALWDPADPVVNVFVRSRVSFNARLPQPLIHPSTDLLATRSWPVPAPWIVPLTAGHSRPVPGP